MNLRLFSICMLSLTFFCSRASWASGKKLTDPQATPADIEMGESSYFMMSPIDYSFSFFGSTQAIATSPATTTAFLQGDARLVGAMKLAQRDAYAFLRHEGEWTSLLERTARQMEARAKLLNLKFLDQWSDEDFALAISQAQ